MSALLCPKCTNIMSRYERNGVVIDQCSGCGGLFLDRGELEHLIQAEAAFYGHSAVARPVDPVPPRAAASTHPDSYRPGYDDRDRRDDDRDRRYDSDRDRREYEKKRKKKKAYGFLEDLLDF